MKTITINMLQERVTNVAGNTSTNWYVYAEREGRVLHTFKEAIKDEFNFFRQFALVTINHPAIMSGNQQEIEQDFFLAIQKELEKDPDVESNRYGALFSKK